MQSFWILVATFSTALTYAAMKLAGADCSFYEILFVRSTYLAAAAVLLACVGGVSLATAHPWLHLRRVAAGIPALSLNILVVRHLPLGVAQTLAYTAPLFIAAWAAGVALWRSGRMEWRLTAAVVAGFAGVCLVMRPTSFLRRRWDGERTERCFARRCSFPRFSLRSCWGPFSLASGRTPRLVRALR